MIIIDYQHYVLNRKLHFLKRKRSKEKTDKYLNTVENNTLNVFEFINKEKFEKKIERGLKAIDIFISITEKDFFDIEPATISSENVKQVDELALNLNRLYALRKTYLRLIDVYKRRSTITAKESRAKRELKADPNIEQARKLAKSKWEKHQNTSLMDMAYEVKKELNTLKSITTIQEWIRDLNPKAKKKKATQ
ncbi:hypothetical protein [Lonepinella sp. MS14437]|uniref:hypothetical protein n=1 Tax=Lonepinella sp. MS14437 TaxID=3003620 RepID=UPI0036DB02E1